ncbi:MAG: hypothetical protein HY698_20660 [Deltaproteobacteria bacterium]|nr:hypothetical protein [Deltaproteobacteria bacterium]
MPTIQANRNPASRIQVGNDILESAKTVDTKPIKERLLLFEKAHRALAAAQAGVDKAEGTLRAAQEKVAEADVVQDEALMALAAALVGEGLPRMNPFKPLGFDAPSTIAKLGTAREAKVVKTLVAKVQKRKGTQAPSLRAARAAEKAALAVERASTPLDRLAEAYRAALSRRTAQELPWEARLAALKRGARAAADDGAPGLFAALFERDPSPPRKARRAPVEVPVETPVPKPVPAENGAS